MRLANPLPLLCQALAHLWRSKPGGGLRFPTDVKWRDMPRDASCVCSVASVAWSFSTTWTLGGATPAAVKVAPVVPARFSRRCLQKSTFKRAP